MKSLWHPPKKNMKMKRCIVGWQRCLVLNHPSSMIQSFTCVSNDMGHCNQGCTSLRCTYVASICRQKTMIWFHWSFLGLALTGGNWQKWKRVFLTCPCHEIYRDEPVGLKSCKNAWKITIFVKMWNLGQYRENLIFCQ